MAKLRNHNHHDHHRRRRPPTVDELQALIFRLATATRNSLRFLSDNNHIIHPSQTAFLDSTLSTSVLSLSSLHNHLRLPNPNPNLYPVSLTTPSTNWFIRFLSQATASRWVETFRMSKPSFFLLLGTLSPSLLSNDPAFPPNQKLAVAILRLAHAVPFRALSRMFGLHRPVDACRAFYEVCKAVIDRLGHLFELETDAERIMKGFRWLSLGGCRGAVGFLRVSVEGKATTTKKKEKIGSNNAITDSLIVQAVVDSEGRFLDVSAGWDGRMHPSEILPNSKLLGSDTILAAGCGTGDGPLTMPEYLVGGSCCPLLPCLMTPFRNPQCLEFQGFNEAHGRAMEVVGSSFKLLVARWRLLGTTWKEACVEALPYVVVCSCLLHNFLVKCREDQTVELKEMEMEMHQRFDEFGGELDERGVRVRRELVAQMTEMRTRIGRIWDDFS